MSSEVGIARVRDIIEAASKNTPNEPWPQPDMRLIDDDRAPAPLPESDSLPAGWEAWIATEAEARGCPRDYVAAGLIGAASAWIGNARRIAATADWSEPAHLWFALIGAPSTGKTPALHPIIKTSEALEQDAEKAWGEALACYERDAEMARTLDEEWREKVRKAAIGQSVAPERPPGAVEPVRPPRPRILAMDTSTEKLQRLLAECPRGLLHSRDELSGWLGSFDRYGGNGVDRAFYLECWNGGTYVCDRVHHHDKPVRIEHASLAIIGGMVPDKLRDVFSGADDGLAERFIYIWPDPSPIAPLQRCDAINAAERQNKLLTAARKLRELAMGQDCYGRPAPHALRLDGDALGLFDEQRQEAMRRARTTSGLIGHWHGKNPGRTLRLALVFELLAWAVRDNGMTAPVSVTANAVARAGGYIDYAEAMLDRAIKGVGIGRADTDAQSIALHILSTQRERLNERELYQTSGFAWARDHKRRDPAFATLERDGWLRRAAVDGHGRPRSDWETNPRIWKARS
jgi:hypothetical protein